MSSSSLDHPGNNSIKAGKSPGAGQVAAKKQRKAKSRNNKHGGAASTSGVISQRVRSEQQSALRNQNMVVVAPSGLPDLTKKLGYAL